MHLQGKIALITGGTGELGRAVVTTFRKRGAEVATTYFSDAEVSTFRTQFPDVLALKGDLSKEHDTVAVFESLVQQKKRVDILCNIVGGYMPKKNIADLSEKEWDFMFALNLKTAFLCSRSAMRIMQQTKYGRIINISAMAGLSPTAGRGAYGISKAAIETLTTIAGEESKAIAGSDITVNAIAPSILLTEANKKSATPEEMHDWVTLEKASEVIAFLASDEASAINGQTIRVYGKI